MSREIFGGGGRTGHLKAITRPPQEVRGGGDGPLDASEVSFFKRLKVLENESIFQKNPNISGRKSPFFPKRNLREIKDT